MTRDEVSTGGGADRTAPPWQEPMSADRSAYVLEPRLVRRRAVWAAFAGSHLDRARHAQEDLAEAGMATAEYAIATLAAVGFAGLLVVILRGDEVKGLLLALIRQALGQ